MVYQTYKFSVDVPTSPLGPKTIFIEILIFSHFGHLRKKKKEDFPRDKEVYILRGDQKTGLTNTRFGCTEENKSGNRLNQKKFKVKNLLAVKHGRIYAVYYTVISPSWRAEKQKHQKCTTDRRTDKPVGVASERLKRFPRVLTAECE